MGLKSWLNKKFTAWLVHEHARPAMHLCDFERMSAEIRPCDVLLIEGRSRVSDIIKNITQTIWTHSALYIGRLRDIDDAALRALIQRFYRGDSDEQLIVEALLGEGTLIKPLAKYRGEHIRICRPKNLSRQDAQHIVGFAAHHLGNDYDFRQLVDLARFMFPYSVVPRRWRSTLFEYHAGIPTRTVCSSMIAAAFANVNYPVMPLVHRGADGKLQLYKRNPRLFTPRDFDSSPYFDIVKYPIFGLNEPAVYRQLPWNKDGVICNDEHDCFIPDSGSASAKVPVVLDGDRTDPRRAADAAGASMEALRSAPPAKGKVLPFGKREGRS